MYAWIVGRIVRGTFARLSRGDHRAAVRTFAPDAVLRFPGDHALGGEYHGREVIAGWFERAWTLLDLRFEIDDVVVRGLPPNTRVCTRFRVRVATRDGTAFSNRGMQYLRLSWGKVVEDELYEDTQAVARAVEHATALAASASTPAGTLADG